MTINGWGRNSGSHWIRPAKRLAIYARDGFCCVYCGSESKLSLDHVKPLALGGGNQATNLVTACIECNSGKRDLGLASWFQVLADRGVDSDLIASRVRSHTRRTVDIKLGKQLLAARKGAACEVQS